jgi:hypothetical protein
MKGNILSGNNPAQLNASEQDHFTRACRKYIFYSVLLRLTPASSIFLRFTPSYSTKVAISSSGLRSVRKSLTGAAMSG